MRVLAFTRYDRTAASTRVRLLQYIPALSEAGIEVEHHALLGDDYVRGLTTGESFPKWRIAAAYGERFRQLLSARDYDVLWVYAELFPFLPAAFERIAFRSGKPLIYDFDDAFFHHYDDHAKPAVRRVLGGKLAALMGGAYACCCGNAYLQNYAARYCARSIVLPTVVDTDVYTPAQEAGTGSRRVTIGWIGSPSTWVLVREYLGLLSELCRDHDVEVRVVGAGRAGEADRFPGLTLIDWSEETEVAEVRAIDIGIMPVWDGAFQRGKSGYKLIQYMACGLPVVASPVGVNEEIVQPESGFLVRSIPEWREALTKLIRDPALRRRMGAVGRRRAAEHYSLAAHAPRFRDLILAADGRGHLS